MYADTEQLPFSCNLCLAAYSDVIKFFEHFKQHGKEIQDKLHVCSRTELEHFNFTRDVVDERATGSYMCTSCSKVFPSICYLHKHFQVSEGCKADKYEVSIKERSVKIVAEARNNIDIKEEVDDFQYSDPDDFHYSEPEHSDSETLAEPAGPITQETTEPVDFSDVNPSKKFPEHLQKFSLKKLEKKNRYYEDALRELYKPTPKVYKDISELYPLHEDELVAINRPTKATIGKISVDYGEADPKTGFKLVTVSNIDASDIILYMKATPTGLDWKVLALSNEPLDQQIGTLIKLIVKSTEMKMKNFLSESKSKKKKEARGKGPKDEKNKSKTETVSCDVENRVIKIFDYKEGDSILLLKRTTSNTGLNQQAFLNPCSSERFFRQEVDMDTAEGLQDELKQYISHDHHYLKTEYNDDGKESDGGSSTDTAPSDDEDANLKETSMCKVLVKTDDDVNDINVPASVSDDKKTKIQHDKLNQELSKDEIHSLTPLEKKVNWKHQKQSRFKIAYKKFTSYRKKRNLVTKLNHKAFGLKALPSRTQININKESNVDNGSNGAFTDSDSAGTVEVCSVYKEENTDSQGLCVAATAVELEHPVTVSVPPMTSEEDSGLSSVADKRPDDLGENNEEPLAKKIKLEVNVNEEIQIISEDGMLVDSFRMQDTWLNVESSTGPTETVSQNTVGPTGTVSRSSTTPAGTASKSSTESTGTISKSSTTPAGTASKSSTEPTGTISKSSTTPAGTASKSSAEPTATIPKSSTTPAGTASKSSTEPTATISKSSTTAAGTVSESSTKLTWTVSKRSIKPTGTVSKSSTVPTVTVSSNSITGPTRTVSSSSMGPTGTVSKSSTKPTGITSESSTETSLSVSESSTKPTETVLKSHSQHKGDKLRELVTVGQTKASTTPVSAEITFKLREKLRVTLESSKPKPVNEEVAEHQIKTLGQNKIETENETDASVSNMETKDVKTVSSGRNELVRESPESSGTVGQTALTTNKIILSGLESISDADYLKLEQEKQTEQILRYEQPEIVFSRLGFIFVRGHDKLFIMCKLCAKKVESSKFIFHNRDLHYSKVSADFQFRLSELLKILPDLESSEKYHLISTENYKTKFELHNFPCDIKNGRLLVVHCHLCGALNRKVDFACHLTDCYKQRGMIMPAGVRYRMNKLEETIYKWYVEMVILTGKFKDGKETLTTSARNLERLKVIADQRREAQKRIKKGEKPLKKKKWKPPPKIPAVCHICGLETFQSYIKIHIKKVHTGTGTGQLEECVVCHDKVPKGKMSWHRRYFHVSEKPATEFACLKCKTVLKDKAALMHHDAIQHSTGPDFQCIYCPKVCKTKSTFRMHLRLHIEDSFSWFCSWKDCEKKFLTKTHLREHMVGHLGSISCPHCSLAYTHWRSLTTHMTAHHKDVKRVNWFTHCIDSVEEDIFRLEDGNGVRLKTISLTKRPMENTPEELLARVFEKQAAEKRKLRKRKSRSKQKESKATAQEIDVGALTHKSLRSQYSGAQKVSTRLVAQDTCSDEEESAVTYIITDNLDFLEEGTFVAVPVDKVQK